MSFLNSNDAEYLSARITQKGRNAIARGSFNIKFFQIGDSEFDYTTPFNGLTGTTGQQKVFSPFDKQNGVKYPYSLDDQKSTTYGTPIVNSNTISIRNVMGAAGFVSDHTTGSTIASQHQTVLFSKISGTTSLVVPTGSTFQNSQFVTLTFNTSTGNTITTGQTNSLVYRVSGVTGNTITLDRNMPNLTGLTGNVQVISNLFNQEDTTGDLLNPIDYTGQLNSWTLNTIWGIKPIGGDYNGTDESLSGYTGNEFISTKQFLGYTSTGQTFTNLTGATITNPTSFANSFSTGSTHELIEVLPSEQRCIAVVHYSQLGDISTDPQRFFKYDDYISNYTNTTGGTNSSIVEGYDNEGDLRSLSDTEYFQIYIPFIYYHRNTGNTLGAMFRMDTTDYYITQVSGITGSRFQLQFRYLLDEQGYKVGKVFVNNKTIVFDDQELVAMLDYRSNRRYTLPSPKLGLTPSDGIIDHSIITSTGQTAWVTYMFGYTGDNKHHTHPCNYFNKITGSTVPSHITMKFSGNSFSNMVTNLSGVTHGFIADKFYALVQINTGQTPTPNAWKKIDITSQIPGYTSGPINPTGLTGNTFTIYMSGYTGTTNYFDIEDHFSGLTTNYLGDTSWTTQPQFGDEQPFPGSVRFVRGSDIEEMNFLVNLPSTQFNTTQNPTYTTGDKKITEVALLDSNKEPLVVAKTSVPLTRSGTQVFAVKLDF